MSRHAVSPSTFSALASIPQSEDAMMDEAREGDRPDLLDRVRRGDQDALAELFSRHRDRLATVVESRIDARLNGRVSASDVLQEAYIEALKRLPHYRDHPDLSFYLWLRWVTMQRLVEIHRHHFRIRRRGAGPEVSIDASSGRIDVRLVDDLTSPSQAAERREALARLQGALGHMDPIDREVLVLRHLEELSNHEVAQILGIRDAAASKRYVRALERLKDALANLPEFAERP